MESGYEYEHGIGHCKIANSCPFCSPRSYAAKRKLLTQRARNAPGGLIVGTLTLPEKHGQPLSNGYQNLLEVRAVFRRKVKTIEAKMGINWSACVIEETYLPGRRWHAHFHWIWFIPAHMNLGQVEQFRESAINTWLTAAKLRGHKSVKTAAQDMKHSPNLVAAERSINYVMKHGFYPDELPRMVFQQSRPLGAFEVLDLARTGEVVFIKAYQEFEVCNKRLQRCKMYENSREAHP
jgi:hypothetical protein